MKKWAFYDQLKLKLEQKTGYKVNLLPKRSTVLEHIADVQNHKCLVSGDSLPMHIALGSGTRCVTIFQCTSPWEIHDYQLQRKVVSPLLGKYFYKRHFDVEATTCIALDEVYRQVTESFMVETCDENVGVANESVTLTGGADKPYSLGMLEALVSKNISVDFIGNDEMSTARIVTDKRVKYFNLRGDQRPASTIKKVIRVLKYYIRLLGYAGTTDTRLIHILWYGRLAFFNRTLLNIYFKLHGKKLVFTAHNIDEKQRDGSNSFLNRFSLRLMYGMVDHIFVHTRQMKSQLLQQFNIIDSKVSVIPFGINNTVPNTGLSRAEARSQAAVEAK